MKKLTLVTLTPNENFCLMQESMPPDPPHKVVNMYKNLQKSIRYTHRCLHFIIPLIPYAPIWQRDT